MSKRYPTLGSPLNVNGVTLKNRMITTSMSPGEGYVVNNKPTDRLASYLEERAKGQTAMIIQTICPWRRLETDGFHPLPCCYDDSCIPDLQKYMIEPVHKHGGLICAQPYYVHDFKPDEATPESPYGPSDIAILKFMGGFKAMTLEQIDTFKNQFFNAARVCKDAGFDAIEVMAGVGGILSRFMSQATNNRTDEYGGSLENRVRLTLEIIRGVREVVGPEFPIVVRWSPVDFISSPNGPGLSMDEALRIAVMLEEAGCDMHDLAIGWHETSVPLTTKVIEDGHWMYVAEQIKSVAKKPVAQGYRNSDPSVMEKNLAEGKADVIAGLRYSIADPELPKKVMEDRTDDMRLCIVCCRCLDDVVSQQKPLEHCGVNPRLGPELDHEAYPPAEKAKNVMVVGSGPGGINAALTAAMRGHNVELYESGPRLGGCVKMSSIFSPYHERYLNYLITQVGKHPEIKVHLNTSVDKSLVASKKPDAVVVAIGGEPIGLDVPGADGKTVVSSHDFLEMIGGRKPKGKKGAFNNFMWGAGSIFLRHYYTPAFARTMTEKSSWPISKKVAIIGGGLPGCEFGHLCMETNRETTIIEEKKKIGFDVGGSDRFGLISGFKKATNVEMYPLTRVTKITDEGVHAIQTTPEGDKEIFVPADTVALTLGFKENHSLGEDISSIVDEVYLVGDCKNPGRIADATKMGYSAGCAL